MKKMFSIMSNLQIHYRFKLDFQKKDQHTRGDWFIHDTIHPKDNHLQSLEILCRISSRESKHDTKESEGNMFKPIFKENFQGQKHRWKCAFAESELLCFRKPKPVVQNKK